MAEEQNQNEQGNNSNDELGSGMQIVSFCIPLVGAIIYFSNKNDNPKKAQSACTAALWGFGLGIVINVLATLGRH